MEGVTALEPGNTKLLAEDMSRSTSRDGTLSVVVPKTTIPNTTKWSPKAFAHDAPFYGNIASLGESPSNPPAGPSADARTDLEPDFRFNPPFGQSIEVGDQADDESYADRPEDAIASVTQLRPSRMTRPCFRLVECRMRKPGMAYNMKRAVRRADAPSGSQLGRSRKTSTVHRRLNKVEVKKDVRKLDRDGVESIPTKKQNFEMQHLLPEEDAPESIPEPQHQRPQQESPNPNLENDFITARGSWNPSTAADRDDSQAIRKLGGQCLRCRKGRKKVCLSSRPEHKKHSNSQ
jgi:hypothetical protein